MSVPALLARRPGLQTTVQDLGRAGYGRYGVPDGGALDSLSLRLGNLLLANPEGAAGLEMTLVGPELEALEPLTCAYTGADMNLVVDGRPVAPGRSFAVRARDVLRFGAARAGARAYLCVAGGIAAPRVLGSRSVAVAAGLGGDAGRPLLGSDVLDVDPVAAEAAVSPGRRLRPDLLREYGGEATLRVVAGPQAPEMEAALEGLARRVWRVGDRWNRIGVRLEGPALPVPEEAFETEGIPLGAVQVPPDGAPILLLADRQTTGGYPKPAVVAAVDLPLAGQLRPGDRVRFRLVPAAEAVRLLREREEDLARGVADGDDAGAGDAAGLVAALEASGVTELYWERRGQSFTWRRE